MRMAINWIRLPLLRIANIPILSTFFLQQLAMVLYQIA